MAWKVVSLFVLLALCEARPPISEQKVKIENIEKKSEHRGEYAWAYPSYEFSYEVVDPHTHDFKGHHETRNGDEVKGHYWLIQPDGFKRTVKYHADKHIGIKTHVDYSKAHYLSSKGEDNGNEEENEGNQEAEANQENGGGEEGNGNEGNNENQGSNGENNENENSNNEGSESSGQEENNEGNAEGGEGNQEGEENNNEGQSGNNNNQNNEDGENEEGGNGGNEENGGNENNNEGGQGKKKHGYHFIIHHPKHIWMSKKGRYDGRKHH